MKVLASNGNVIAPGKSVLFRDGPEDSWKLGYFVYLMGCGRGDYACTEGTKLYKECIPFAGNELLQGTTMPIPPRGLEFGDKIMVWDSADLNVPGREAVFCHYNDDGESIMALPKGCTLAMQFRHYQKLEN